MAKASIRSGLLEPDDTLQWEQHGHDAGVLARYSGSAIESHVRGSPLCPMTARRDSLRGVHCRPRENPSVSVICASQSTAVHRCLMLPSAQNMNMKFSDELTELMRIVCS